MNALETQVKRLEAAFQKPIPKVRLDLLARKLKGYDIGCITRAIDYLIEHNKDIPINADIYTAVGIENEKLWQQKKRKEIHDSEEFFKPGTHKSQYGKDALNCLNGVINARTREEKYNLMIDMESKYPGKGYKEEAFEFLEVL